MASNCWHHREAGDFDFVIKRWRWMNEWSGGGWATTMKEVEGEKPLDCQTMGMNHGNQWHIRRIIEQLSRVSLFRLQKKSRFDNGNDDRVVIDFSSSLDPLAAMFSVSHSTCDDDERESHTQNNCSAKATIKPPIIFRPKTTQSSDDNGYKCRKSKQKKIVIILRAVEVMMVCGRWRGFEQKSLSAFKLDPMDFRWNQNDLVFCARHLVSSYNCSASPRPGRWLIPWPVESYGRGTWSDATIC